MNDSTKEYSMMEEIKYSVSIVVITARIWLKVESIDGLVKTNTLICSKERA